MYVHGAMWRWLMHAHHKREIRAEIDVFGAFEPDLVLLPGQDPMCLDMDFLGSFDSHERGDEIVRADFARFDLPATRSPFQRARGFDHDKRKVNDLGDVKRRDSYRG